MNYQEAISRAMKLLAKGNCNGATSAESAAFLAGAQKIIDEYKLDVNDLKYDEEQEKDDNEPIMDFGFGDPLDQVKYGQYRETWTRRLGNVIAHHNQSRVVYQTNYDKSITIKLIGRPSDVSVVRYLYSFYKRQVEELAAEACKGRGGPFRGQFCMGVIDTLWNKLNGSRKETQEAKKQEHVANPLALMRVNGAIARIEKRDKQVDEWMKQNLKLGKGRGFNYRTATGGRTEGQIAGQKLRMTGAKGQLAQGDHKPLPKGARKFNWT